MRNKSCKCNSGLKSKFCCDSNPPMETCTDCKKSFNPVIGMNKAIDVSGETLMLRCPFCNFFMKGGNNE